jgi:hypothetical protein
MVIFYSYVKLPEGTIGVSLTVKMMMNQWILGYKIPVEKPLNKGSIQQKPGARLHK